MHHVRAIASLLAVAALSGVGCSRNHSLAPPGDGGSSDGSGGPGGPGSPGHPSSCSNKTAQPLDGDWTLMVGGVARVAHVHVPASYDPSAPTAFVINLHGYTSNGMQQDFLSKMTAKADVAGFVVAHPDGTGSPTGWNAGTCCGQAAMNHVDDIGFMRALVDEADARLCLDTRRVYATGMSNGGFLSQRIACEMADRVAAVAPVAGVLGIPAASCMPARPISVLEFHGNADPVVPYGGDAMNGWPSVMETFTGWAARDRCTDAAPAETYNMGDAKCDTYSRCAAGVAVTLCTIDMGGHTWPGGTPIPFVGNTSTSISATDAMWTFFQQHPLP
jgi:polyhydroxybutyrate depolymerase